MRVPLAGCWWLNFGQSSHDEDCLLAADKDAACLCFGCRRDNVLEGFTNDLYGAVERKAFGGGVAEVEDAGEATACLGEEEVICV